MALVHDYLNQRGGAERVLLTLSDLFPQAPIYTSLFRPQSTFSEFSVRDIRTTWLDRLPVDRAFRALLPFYAPAFASLPPIDAEIVISQSTGWAHMARTTERALHIVYCHTPARWLISSQRSSSRVTHALAAPLFPLLRRVDARAARRADLYIANSRNVQRKILTTYGIEAVVLHPPVDISRFVPTPRGDRLLAVSRLLPYKRLDLVIRAANRLGLPLDIVGTGPALASLKQISGPLVSFHGAVSDETLASLMQDCLAVCIPGEEDFGIVPIEAQAAGKPVIAYAAGGALETVSDGLTGVLFDRQDPDALVAAIERVTRLATPPEVIASHAARFSPARFARELTSLLARALAHHRQGRVGGADRGPARRGGGAEDSGR